VPDHGDDDVEPVLDPQRLAFVVEPACVAEGLRTDVEAVAGVADGEEVRVVLVPGLGAGVEVRHDCWPAVDRAHQRALHEPDGDLR
jgi:hypothetical protein